MGLCLRLKCGRIFKLKICVGERSLVMYAMVGALDPNAPNYGSCGILGARGTMLGTDAEGLLRLPAMCSWFVFLEYDYYAMGRTR